MSRCNCDFGLRRPSATCEPSCCTLPCDILNEDGPDALQTRKIASAAGTSTMAVYTHFGGMPALIAAVAEEGLRQFDAAMTMPPTSDPVADLMATGIAYRRYAIERPHMYRLMFGSTSAHGINAPAHDVLTLTLAEINDHYPSFAHVVRGVHRSMLAGRIAGSPDRPPTTPPWWPSPLSSGRRSTASSCSNSRATTALRAAPSGRCSLR